MRTRTARTILVSAATVGLLTAAAPLAAAAPNDDTPGTDNGNNNVLNYGHCITRGLVQPQADDTGPAQVYKQFNIPPGQPNWIACIKNY